jgi:hypothetical protein
MSNIFKPTRQWYTDLCEYYGVTPEKALELGSRSEGRKPDLPGSKTCQPVSGMTFEDIWALEKRDSVESVYKFYKDQGAWSSFRQCVRHKDMEKLHMSFFQTLSSANVFTDGYHICEYGAGVAPFTMSLLKYVDDKTAKKLDFKITIADLDCEHFDFAKYRLNSIKEKREMKNLELVFKTITPAGPPEFDSTIDAVICFEVLEHVPSPVDVLMNFKNNMKYGSYYFENFIKHDHDEKQDHSPDLDSARNEREAYYKTLNDHYDLVYPDKETSDKNPNVTRIWIKN